MQLEKLNPMTTPARANIIGSGSLISSAAIEPDYNTAAAVVQKLQRDFRISELHALTVLRLANLGPKEGRD